MTRHEIDDAAVARIAKHIRARGPGIIRRAQFVHRARPIAVAALSVGAIVLLIARWDRPQPAAPVADLRACASWSRVEANQRGRLELGPRGIAIGSDGEVRVESTEPCATQLALERGRVIVHVRELGGGELRVRSGEELVIARGTVFAVAREGTRFEVDVAEGRVELRSSETTSIDAGEHLVLEHGTIARSPMTEASKSSMLIAVGLLAERPEIGDRSEEAERSEKAERIANRPDLGELKQDPPRRVTKKRTKSHHVPPSGREERSQDFRSNAAPIERDAEQPANLMLEAHAARKRGDLASARELFVRAGRSAEAAWMSLARMELDAERADAAIAALDERQRRFGEGSLAIEASWLRVRALAAKGERAAASAEAKRIIERWPDSPYAESARRWLEKER